MSTKPVEAARGGYLFLLLVSAVLLGVAVRSITWGAFMYTTGWTLLWLLTWVMHWRHSAAVAQEIAVWDAWDTRHRDKDDEARADAPPDPSGRHLRPVK